MNANRKTNETKTTETTKRPNPLDRLDSAVMAAQLLARRYQVMAEDIIFASHQVDFQNDERREIDALVQKILNITGTTNGVVVGDLIDAYERGGR